MGRLRLGRKKVTLSIPRDVAVALRIAKAESGKQMSVIVAEALEEFFERRRKQWRPGSS